MSYSKIGLDTDGNIIEVNQGDRGQGCYIIGAPGKGKSVLLHNLILQDITQGIGVIVVDPNRDLINNIIQTMPANRLDDVVLLDIQETDNVFGLNLYQCSDPTSAKEIQYTMDRVMRIWDRLFTIKRENPLMQNHLRNSAHLIIANPGYTLADIPLIYYDDNLRQKLVANVKDMYVKLFWQSFENPVSKLDRSREVSAILNKFTEYVQPMIVNIIGQSKSTVDFRWCMDNHKIVFLQLDQNLLATTQLIGGTLISLVLQAAFSRINIPLNKRRQCNVYIDELDYQATLDTQQLYQEGRKHGVTITAAHQSRVKLHNEVPELARGILGAATTVCFQVTPPDSEEVAGKFDTTPPEPPMEESGKRKIQTPVTNVIEALLNRGSHVNAKVNAFLPTLRALNNNRDGADTILWFNTFLYQSMIGQKPQRETIEKFLPGLVGNMSIGLFYLPVAGFDSFPTKENTQAMEQLYQLWETGDTAYYSTVYAITYERTKTHVLSTLTVIEGFVNNCYDELVGEYEKIKEKYASLEEAVKKVIESAYYQRRIADLSTWFKIDLTQLEFTSGTRIFTSRYKPMGISQWQLLPNQEWKIYKEADLVAEVKRQFAEDKDKFDALIVTLKRIAQALASNPILADSGEEEVIYKPGQRKSHTERQKEIENQLSSLAPLHARAKLADFPIPLKSKVCHICGKALAVKETQCDVCKVPLQPEYVITVKRYNGIYANLDQRRQQIIQKNVQDGFLRERTIVEAEIASRQRSTPPPANQPTSSPNPKNPPAPAGAKANIPQSPSSNQVPTPRTRAINTPATKQCPSCKAQNTLTALFCNMCGSKL